MPAIKKIKGRYEVRSVLGEGGMGVVYRAFDPPPMSRDVALKTLLELPDPSSLQLFYKECQMLKSISHPNIVEIFDIGEFEDSGTRIPFFVMPLLPGNSLDVLIRDTSHSLSVERVIDIVSQTCRGLQAAHERGLVHRDLKPSNLFILADDSVKIIDFGIAHTVDARSRTAGLLKGTLLYMAPEQLQHKPVSAQSDIYSLAVVCYEALTRRQPFRGPNEEHVINAILKEIPTPASDINPAVNSTVARVVHKAMAKQPWNRFDSAREFGENLQKALRNQPIELFDPARIQPRIKRAAKALDSGDFQFAGEIVGELEAEGNIDPELTLLRNQIDLGMRKRTVAQLLESARARFEEEEDPLALQKIQEILQFDPNNVAALGLKVKIDDRRSERQIEKWIKLALQHIDNHAYGHAREALQNVLQLRPNESRAVRMISNVQAEEKEYLRVRQQKSQTYQQALNLWKNGDVTQALDQMEVVLELDRKAPDSTSPETSAAYQSFYNKVRSERDAIASGYAQAQRALAEQDFTKASQICQEFLVKYPNQALFQAFQYDLEEQRRQQLSAFIAEVDRKLDRELDLDAKISLLREALARYPGESHFERSLRLASDKRELVNGILSRARTHEERGEISEALGDLEILRTIYSPYPGLQFEIERLRKRREQQSKAAMKARWIEQSEQKLQTGAFAEALDLLHKAQTECPGDVELLELEKRANLGLERANQAEQLLAVGQQLGREGRFEEGLETLRKAQNLDEQNPQIRSVLLDTLTEHARVLLESDWQAADALAAEALQFDSGHPLARSIRSQIQDRKREEVVAAVAMRARRLLAEGDLEGAAAEVKQGLASSPSDQRLAGLRDTINKELGQARRIQERVRYLADAKSLQQEVTFANDDQLTLLYGRSRDYSREHPEDEELQTITREIARVVKERGGAPLTPQPKPSRQKAHTAWSARASSWYLQAKTVLRRHEMRLAGGMKLAAVVGGALLLLLLAWLLWPKPKHPPLATSFDVVVDTSPSDALVSIDGKAKGASPVHTQLAAGTYKIEASARGYETSSSSLLVNAGSSNALKLSLHLLPERIRLVTPDLETGEVSLDGSVVGHIEAGEFTLPNLEPGPHELHLVVSQGRQDVSLNFKTAPGAMPAVDQPIQARQLQLVVIGSAAGSAHILTPLDGVHVAVDGKDGGLTAPTGVQVNEISDGTHELTLGSGDTARKMSFDMSAAPGLQIVVFSDRDAGSILVQTGQDGAYVFVDDKLYYASQTRKGQLRIPNLQTTPHTIRVHKDGFRDPPPQTVGVKKGQEVRLQFVLEPPPSLAGLELQGMPPGTLAMLDTTSLGPPVDGLIKGTNITPGEHKLCIDVPHYQQKCKQQLFAGGTPVQIPFNEADFRRSGGTLNVIAVANTTIDVEQDGRLLRHFAGSQKLALEQGQYTLTYVLSGVSQKKSVTIADGDTKSIDLQNHGGGMEFWEHPEQWVEEADGWMVRRGPGNFFYNNPVGPGTFSFAVKLHLNHLLFGHSSRLRWILGHVDSNNYTQMELDNKWLYRSDIVEGKRFDQPKVAHNIPDKAQTMTLTIEILSDGTVKQRYSVNDSTGAALGSPAGANQRSLAAGRFGFAVLPDRDIEIKNFRFTAGSAH